jgi:hypothetical protein
MRASSRSRNSGPPLTAMREEDRYGMEDAAPFGSTVDNASLPVILRRKRRARWRMVAEAGLATVDLVGRDLREAESLPLGLCRRLCLPIPQRSFCPTTELTLAT